LNSNKAFVAFISVVRWMKDRSDVKNLIMFSLFISLIVISLQCCLNVSRLSIVRQKILRKETRSISIYRYRSYRIALLESFTILRISLGATNWGGGIYVLKLQILGWARISIPSELLVGMGSWGICLYIRVYYTY